MNHKTTSKLTAPIILLIIIWTVVTPSLCDTQITTDLAHDLAPSVIQGSDGTIRVVWHSLRTGNNELFYKKHDGISWLPEEQLTNDTNVDGLPSIIQAADGTLWVVWTSSRTGNYDLFCKNSSDGGSSWSNATSLTTNPDYDSDPSIIQAADGTLWVVWTSSRTGNYDLFCKNSSDGGSSWSNATPLTEDLNNDENPSIMQTSDGTLWVVWTSNRTGNKDIFFKTSANNGVSWSSETQLTTNTFIDYFPSVMQASDGTIWVAWQVNRGVQDDICYKIYNGSSWSPNNYLTWFMENDRMPSIFQAANGTIWLVWASDKPDNFDIYYKFVRADMVTKDMTIVPKTIVTRGTQVDINVIVGNEGTVGVTFDVTAYHNETQIGTERKSMTPSLLGLQSTFTWNTTESPYGYYSILATVSTAFLSDSNPADNSLTSAVIVTIPGDANGDGRVDIIDGGVISAHWYPGPPIGPLGYDANADLNSDGKVDITDATIVNANWQNSW